MLVITLGSRMEPCRSRGAVVVCGSNITEGVGGIGVGGVATLGAAVATASPGANSVLASAGVAAA